MTDGLFYRFPDDVLFDEFVDVHHNDLLETECYRAAQRLAERLADMFGEGAVTGLMKQVEADAYASRYPLHEARKIVSGLPPAGYLEVFDRLADAPDLSLPLTRYAHDLKMFAMIGAIDLQARSLQEIQQRTESVVLWADRLARSSMDERTEPYFCFFAKAAKARLDLDMGRDPQLEPYACLASLARHPLAEPLTPSVFDTPKKTIQNLISAKTLERIGEDRLAHATALQWMSKQWSDAVLFPSSVFNFQPPVSTERTYADPVFVPNILEARYKSEEPFLPMHGNSQGFDVRLATGDRVIPDFWQAVETLKIHPGARVKTRHASTYSPLSGNWSIIERKLVEEMIKLESTRSIGEEATLADQCARAAARHDSVSEHRKGHSQKLYRFRLSNGNELAIEKRLGRPLVYIPAKETFRSALADKIVRTKGPDPQGRNSNLNAMDAFINQPLFVLRPESVADMEVILGVIINEGGH